MSNEEARCEVRFQDGTINDAYDFWQLVQDVGYLIEGEPRAYEREKMRWLDECLGTWLAGHDVGEASAKLHRFAMESVARLVHAFTFNDDCGADRPDFKERLLERIEPAIVDIMNEEGGEGGPLQ